MSSPRTLHLYMHSHIKLLEVHFSPAWNIVIVAHAWALIHLMQVSWWEEVSLRAKLGMKPCTQPLPWRWYRLFSPACSKKRGTSLGDIVDVGEPFSCVKCSTWLDSGTPAKSTSATLYVVYPPNFKTSDRILQHTDRTYMHKWYLILQLNVK